MNVWQHKKTPLLVLLGVAAATTAVLARKAPAPDAGAGRADRPAPIARRIAAPAMGVQRVLVAHDEAALKVPVAATPAGDPRLGTDFAANYGRSFHPAGALFGPSGSADQANTAEADGADDFARSAGPDFDTPADAPRRHVVVDGDTLSKLAARYLGSKDRYLEIFYANRQVLSNPDLLPIGAALEIPRGRTPAEAAQSQRNTASFLPIGIEDRPADRADSDLVPVDASRLNAGAP